ncbi:hypothetical protein K443DRAFT_98341, partial [Laccaria amethystina LaAM-08-1]
FSLQKFVVSSFFITKVCSCPLFLITKFCDIHFLILQKFILSAFFITNVCSVYFLRLQNCVVCFSDI